MSHSRQGASGAELEWYRCTAFGLTVQSDWPLAGSTPASDAAMSPRPVTTITRVSSARVDEAWASSAERILEHRLADGAIGFTVDRAPEHYRFWLEGFGRYLVARDGTTINCEFEAAGRQQHERFVLAHALPVAAVLRGYEVLHVSAISVEGGAVAFAGASGAGKTRLASRLVARGASFLTDDVLAVEAAPGDQVLAHPGPAVMAIRHDDASMLAEVKGRLGPERGATDKVHVSPPSRGQVSKLRALYHIRWGDTFEVSPLEGADLQRTLALSFVPYLTTPERLVRHLAIAQLVSVGVAQFRLQTPGTQLVDEMLITLEAHMRKAAA